MVKSCWRVSSEDGDSNGKIDGLLWYKDIGKHCSGEFSMAVVQANSSLEDHSQLESGPLSFTKSGPHGTIVGVYDGHGGPEASSFVNNNLVRNFKRLATENGVISENVIRKAFAETENDFLSLVKKQWLEKPQLASTGSCCLVGIISQGLLHIANLGDSTVVLGRAENWTRGVRAIQLSQEHNANIESVREELRKQHADDPNIVVLRHKVWRVKGVIQVSRSIGDAYLKKAEFNQEPLPTKFRLREAFNDPILSSEPAISSFKLKPEDQFLIFASDGLWEQLTNQEATDIVYRSPRKGVAKKLAKMALQEAARKREMRYSDLIKIDAGVRRHFHDDITVVVVFIDQNVHNTSTTSSSYSITGGVPE